MGTTAVGSRQQPLIAASDLPDPKQLDVDNIWHLNRSTNRSKVRQKVSNR